MKKTLLIAALASAALVSCSKDEVVKINQDEIKFSVVADNQTKAENVYCAYNLITEFDVYGTYSDGTNTSWYFQKDHIAYENSAWVNKTTTRYWSEGTHDFYAIANGEMTVTAANMEPTVVDFTPDSDVSKQKDLLYAVATGQTKSIAAVSMNFRHALSQIEFMARNTNSQLHVVVDGVQVGQTPGVGTFTYPTTSTKDNFTSHDQSTTHSYTTGSWSVETATDYVVSFDPVAVEGDNTAVGLTLSKDANDNTRSFKNSMLLLPANTTSWTPADGETTYDGTYLAVKCKIYNVAGTAYESTTDVCIHDGWAVIPVSFAWEPGKKYIYTFVFGEGNGGYDGGDDPDEPSVGTDPVLTPISYTVTVDDFQKGVDDDVDMKF